jgi:predicted nucleic acid-binding protein
MAAYFLDSAAITKRYFVEPGHDWVRRLCDQVSGNIIYISEAALVEMTATLYKKARLHPTFRADRDATVADFERHAASNAYHVRETTPGTFRLAASLCKVHALGSLDALQLACALEIALDAGRVGAQAPIFVTADKRLRNYAKAQGLQVENPERYALPPERTILRLSLRERAIRWGLELLRH